jgi:signal transduction histidine kinase
MVVNSALKMRKLIEDMTNLRFLDIGESELKLEMVTLAELMKLAESDVNENDKTDGHQVTIELPDEEIHLHADRSKLLMAISKLLDNAIKFSPPKTGKIHVLCESRPNEIWLSISDNGVGIPDTELENIFKPFQQVEDHMTRRYGGMGLGLAISRSVIEVHKGRIWAESAGPDQGARFVVSLPKAAL